VTDILEKNYRTYCSQNDIMMDDSVDIGILIDRVLEETEMTNMRAGKCDEADFLKLLYAFHQVGIHFA
jgi:18S rRNA (adenine1779-N6/adenine1780-N6)-dimethyltransferase